MSIDLHNTMSPRVAIVILNWNGREDTLECLASVSQLDYPNYEIVVVDNGSTDDSVETISKQYPGIALVQTGSNLGYAGGNNVGIRWALDHAVDYVLLLNNDTIVSPDLLRAFVIAKDLLPANAVLGAKIFFYDEPDKLWFAGGRWDDRSNSFKHVGLGQKDSTEFSRMTEVDYVTGCALFVSATAIKEIGLLDESFFLTYEETDWCYRARARGHKCIFVPDAKLWHKVSASFGGNSSPLHNYFMVRNKLLWAKKHLSRSARVSLLKENIRTLRGILLPRFILFRTPLPFTKGLLWDFSSWLKAIKKNINNPINKSTLFGLRDYYLGRFGDCPEHVRKLANPTA